jgi:hypothetical protein
MNKARSAAVLGVLGVAAGCSGQGPLAGGNDGGDRAQAVAEASAPDVASAGSIADAEDDAGDAEATFDAIASDAGLALSDGFETAAVGGAPDPGLWTVASQDCSGSGTLAVDDSQAHTGRHSVRVDGGGGYCDHVFFANTAAIAAVTPQVYARFFVMLGAPLGAGHTTFLAMKDQADDGKDVRMGGQDMILMYNRQSDDATLPVLSPTGVADSVAPPASAWTCIELHVDETAGTIDTWVNGAEVPGLVENGASVADVSTQWLSRAWKPSLVDFRLGWESYAGQAMTLWFDDVAVSGRRIGCAD